MKILGNQPPPPETVRRALTNLSKPEKMKNPLAAAFYLTFGCNARCGFCSQSEQINGRQPKPNTEKQLEILRTIREDVPGIYFLGGEPTVHPDFGRFMEESTALDFDTIGVNTNGIRYCPEIPKHANLIVASLHTTDPKRIGEIYKRPKQGPVVLDNIRRYAQERDVENSEMKVNCVVTGDNIRDAYEVAEFCRELGIKLSIVPAIKENGRPDDSLINNPEYITLIEWAKKQKELMGVSPEYLKTIQNFSPFTCTPNVIPAIHPNGDMPLPCPNMPGRKLVNIMETGGVNNGLRIGREEFEREHGVLDTRKKCAHLCHKACYIEGAGISTIMGLMKQVRNLASGALT